jgi:glucose/arabinose dehydrogenase
MKLLLKATSFIIVAVTLIISCNKDESLWDWMIPETEDTITSAEIKGFVFYPALAPATADNMKNLKVPAGFSVTKFADNLGKPRILVVNSNGTVYVSDRDKGIVMMLRDSNGDGTADQRQTVATIKNAHGLAIHGGKMYIAAIREVYAASINNDGTLGSAAIILRDLPDAGQHPNRTIAFGPDGMLYLSIGSTCNSCPEPNPLNATLVKANPDGSNLTVVAKGLRNTIGFGWHPQSGALWGADHGIDWLGDDDQKEEINQIKQGANYGWPYIYGEGKYNPGDRPEGDTTYQQYLAQSTLPTLTYQAHAAPMQMAFYNGAKFPAEFRGDAFIAMRGSWNRSQPVGYKVVRLHFENGVPVRFDDFLTGFLLDNNKAHMGRLVGVAVHNDGSLLVSDDTNGVIYRVSYP